MPSLCLLAVNARFLELDRTALTRLISDAQPQVVCLHSAPAGPRWRSACAAVARMSGLVVVSGGRLGGGNLIMSTLGVDSRRNTDVRFGGSRRWGAPGATLAALRVSGSEVVVGSARLVGNAAERLGQVAELEAAVASLVPSRPLAVLAVDGADRPGTSSWQALLKDRTAVGSGIFIDGRVTVERTTVLDESVRQFPPTRLDLVLP